MSIFTENHIKNVLSTLIGLSLIPYINEALLQASPESIGDVLMLSSILLVTASFPNFAFTYEKVHMHRFIDRLIAHCATGIFIFISLVLLLTTVASIKLSLPSLYPLSIILSSVLYLGIILYDYWDLLRCSPENLQS